MEGLVYKCEGKKGDNNEENKWEYIGETGGNIKKRISNHISTFKHRAEIPQTTLTARMWEEKDRGEKTKLVWSKLAIARPIKPNQKACNLCSKETILLMSRSKNSLNKRRN